MKRNMLLILVTAVLISVLFGTASATETGYSVLEADAITTVSIDVAGENAYYQFVPDFSCAFAFHAVSEEDTYGELYDADGNLLYENDDFYGLNFGIECTLEAGKVYILSVCFLDTEITGSFDLVTTTNHDVVSELTKVGDCFEDGLWTHSCNLCGHSWTEVVPAAHQYEDGVCVVCGTGIVLSGICGDALEWYYDGSTTTLTISGTGPMYDYDEDTPPWYELSDSVSKVVIENGVTYIGNYAFSGMETISLVTIPNSVTAIGDSAFSYCGNMRSFTLSSEISSIGAYAFAYDRNLTEINIPASVTEIGGGAFQGCDRVTKICVDEGNAYYSSDSYGVLFDKNKNQLLQAPAAMRGAYAIPNTVSVIGDAAFDGCDGLSALTIPNSVTEIGSYAFTGCTDLTFLRIPVGVTAIGDAAFSNCTAMKGILFEGDAPTVDGEIIDNVTATAYYPASNQTWTEDAMTQCASDITWKAVSGLEILVQPENQEDLVGNIVTLTVGASGADLEYVWWVAEPGSDSFVKSAVTGNIYSVQLTTQNIGQQVYCVITDGEGGEVRSETVTIRAMSVLELDVSYSVTVDAENKFKYFAFTPDYNCYYTFSSFGDMDTYCELYDAQYNVLNSNDDGADSNFNLYTLLEAGKTYIFGVHIYNDGAGTTDVLLKANHIIFSIDTPPTCSVDGYTTHTCSTCGYSYTVPGEEAYGHSWDQGFCTTCGIADPDYVDPVVVPTLQLIAPALNFENVIYYNIYYSVTDMTDVEEMGLITFNAYPTNGTVDNADGVVPGYTQSGSNYMSHTNGIPAKELSDARYFRVYVKLSDGSYVYSDVAGYHAVAYARDILANSTSEKMKALVVAMLNYGAAAQTHFDYKADNLMNSFLTAEQQALVCEYSDDMVNGLVTVPPSKVGPFNRITGSYSALAPNVSFEGAFSINYYFTPVKAMDGELKLYYWTLDDYNAVDVLTTKNATGVVVMEETSVSGKYFGALSGIAAKQIDETFFACGVYECNGVSYPTGILTYSLAAYCQDRIANGSENMQALAKQTIIYGYYAKNYFAS